MVLKKKKKNSENNKECQFYEMFSSFSNRLFFVFSSLKNKFKFSQLFFSKPARDVKLKIIQLAAQLANLLRIQNDDRSTIYKNFNKTVYFSRENITVMQSKFSNDIKHKCFITTELTKFFFEGPETLTEKDSPQEEFKYTHLSINIRTAV